MELKREESEAAGRVVGKGFTWTKYKRNSLSNTNNDCLVGRQNSGLGSLLYKSCKM